MSGGEERNLPPTPLRLQQARAVGDVPKSRELAASLSALGVLGAAYLTVNPVASWLMKMTTRAWSAPAKGNADLDILQLTQTWLFGLASASCGFVALVILTTVVAHWVQTGFLWTPGRLKPDVSHLGPRKFASQFTLVHWVSVTWLGIPKIIIGLVVMLVGTYYQRAALFGLAELSMDRLPGELFQIVIHVCLQVVVALTVLGVADYGWQWLGYRRRMQMTRQEVRDEQMRQGNRESVGQMRRSQRTSGI